MKVRFGALGAVSAIAIAYGISGAAAAQTAPPPDTVVIEGRRLSQADEAIGIDATSNTVAVTRDALLSAPAGISGLKMLETLPGFNVQTDGALGLYEFGNSVTVRAFNLQQIGFVLDGIPMGRSDAFGGSPIFRYVDNENLGAVVASTGAGDVSQPSYASLGPIVEYKSINPSSNFGATVSQAFGDDNLNRSFIKLQSGDIGGFSAYASRSKTDSDLWRGGGSINREHIEGKLKYAWSSDTSLTVNYVSNDFHDFDSPSISKAQYASGAPDNNGKTGRDIGYAKNIPNLPLGLVIDYGVQGYTNAGFTDWYQDRINIRKDSLYGATFKTRFGDAFGLSATAYYEDKDGTGVSPDSYTNTRPIYLRQLAAGLAVTAPRGVQYGISGVGGVRKGAVLKGEYDLGINKLEAGVWLETDDYTRSQYRVNHAGGIQTGNVLYNEVAYYRRLYESTRDTTQLFVKDTISLLDNKLKVEFGIKSLDIDYSLSGYRDFNDYEIYGKQTVGKDYKKNFLPMLGAVWQVTPGEQLFASYAQNYALPRGADDVFSVANNPANSVPYPDGEKAENFEIGARTLRGELDGAIAVFYTKFDNRLETYAVPLAGAAGATETETQNVGSVKAYGVELTGAWKPAFLHQFAYFNGNVTYNHVEFQDNIPNYPATPPVTTVRGTLPIAGNIVPDSPEWIVTAGVTVEPTTWIVANLSAKYISKRYSNFVNTESVDGFTIASAYVDIGDGDKNGFFHGVKARINVDNIFDEDTLAFISPTVGTAAVFRPQSPRTFSFSLTADF
jgi:iron complex outermembrane receptor protein